MVLRQSVAVQPVWILALLVALMPAMPAHGGSGSYDVRVDGHSYDVRYSVDADVIAMAIDQELDSLLIGLENAQDSEFVVYLPGEMISAEGDRFVILVDWVETDYELAGPRDQVQQMPVTAVKFTVPEGAVEVEIIGTRVVPEFALGAMAAFGVLLAVTTVCLRGRPFRW